MTSALESSIHMPLSLWPPFKESVSHGSENGGNYYRRVGSRRRGRRKLGQNTNNQRHWRYHGAFRSRTEPSGQPRSCLGQVLFDTCKLALISYRGYGAGRGAAGIRGGGTHMLQGIARLAIRAPRRIIGVAVLVFVAAAIFGIPVAESLSPGGFQDPKSESARAIQLLTDKFGQSGQQMLILVTAPGGANSEQARQVGPDPDDQVPRIP